MAAANAVLTSHTGASIRVRSAARRMQRDSSAISASEKTIFSLGADYGGRMWAKGRARLATITRKVERTSGESLTTSGLSALQNYRHCSAASPYFGHKPEAEGVKELGKLLACFVVFVLRF